MPPLSYDAKAAVQRDDFDPKLILLVRRVRVRPTLIFQGRVEEPPAPVAQPTSVGGRYREFGCPGQEPQGRTGNLHSGCAAQDDGSVVNRVRAFFRRLFS